jgi:hypothetical protein
MLSQNRRFPDRDFNPELQNTKQPCFSQLSVFLWGFQSLECTHNEKIKHVSVSWIAGSVSWIAGTISVRKANKKLKVLSLTIVMCKLCI